LIVVLPAAIADGDHAKAAELNASWEFMPHG
jgi:hypothetical protein